MENINQIFLIGMMGSGKSTVGAMLAEQLDWTFIDIDAELEKDNGLSVSEMFKDGESTFRTYEAEKLKEIVSKDDIVCATGGGIVLNDDNYKILNQSRFIFGVTVCRPVRRGQGACLPRVCGWCYIPEHSMGARVVPHRHSLAEWSIWIARACCACDCAGKEGGKFEVPS